METEFKVGDRVRLTGSKWEGTGHAGELVVLSHVTEDGYGFFPGGAEGGWFVYPDSGSSWAGEVVPSDVRVEDLIEPLIPEGFAADVDRVLGRVGQLLVEKNTAYGNSALNPVQVFSQVDAEEQLKVRIDDKLSRLKRGKETEKVPEDTVLDLIGYLVLLTIAQED